MTDERKIILFDEVVNYIYLVVGDDDEFLKVLNRIGFTDAESAEWI